MRTYRAAFSVLAAAVLVSEASASMRPKPVEHFTAQIAVASSPARIAFRTVDIAIARWSTRVEHRSLETALLERGWVEYVDVLCTLASVGSIATVDGRDIAIRYAWQVVDSGGGRRVFLATDEPITLANPMAGRTSVADSFSFWKCASAPTVRAKESCPRRRACGLMKVRASSSCATMPIGST